MAREKIRGGLLWSALLLCVGIAVVMSGGLRTSVQVVEWVAFDLQRMAFPEQDAAGPTYDDTAKGPVPLGQLIGQLRVAWPGERVAMVHDAACDVATGLLHHRDIEVGDVVDRKFVAWTLSPWQADAKIRGELMPMREYYLNEMRVVFRRKGMAGATAGAAPAAVGRGSSGP